MDPIDHSTPVELFKNEIEEVSAKRRIELTETAKAYITFLLASIDGQRFMMQSKRSNDSRIDHGPSMTFVKALSLDRQERVVLLQKVGDTSLMFAGFWSEFAHIRLASINHYMTLGQNAYGILYEEHITGPFEELSDRFQEVVWILNEISERFTLTTMNDILRLYNKWQESHDPHLAEILIRHRINPLSIQKKQ